MIELTYNEVLNIIKLTKKALKYNKEYLAGLYIDNKKKKIVSTDVKTMFIKDIKESLNEENVLLINLEKIKKTEYCKIIYKDGNYIQNIYNNKNKLIKEVILQKNKYFTYYPNYESIIPKNKNNIITLIINPENLPKEYDKIKITFNNDNKKKILTISNPYDNSIYYTIAIDDLDYNS